MAVPKDTIWQIEPHTSAKHQILRKYLDAWLPILGTYSKRVVYVDGFAGPGQYTGGEPGSPIVALRAALTHQAKLPSELVFLFIEKDNARADHLTGEIAKLQLTSAFKVQVGHAVMDSVTLAEVLSPSQISQFLNCPAKWMFRYLLDLKDPGTAATALGTAFHETIAHNFRQKRETAGDLPLAECQEFFRNALGRQLETIRLQKDEHPMEALELGETMIAKYMEEAAPSIQPAVVESRVSGLIGGVKVSGYVDLLDTEGRLIDSKSSTKPIKGIAHDHRLQLTSYAMITPAASGACRLDTVTKGQTVTLIQKSFCVSEKDRQYAEVIYPMVQDSIREGIFLPRRNSSLCSRRYCGYWTVCEKEYGGSVRE